MASPIGGPVETRSIPLYRSAQRQVIRASLPDRVTPFQAAWLKIISLREEIDALVDSLGKKRPLAEQAAAALAETSGSIEEKTMALETQRRAISQAEATALQKLDTTPQAQELSGTIVELQAALERINGAIEGVLTVLERPSLKEGTRGALEKAKEEGEATKSELAAALGTCKAALDTFKSVLMKPVEKLRAELVDAEREADLPGLQERQRQLREDSAQLQREVQEEGARLDALREELGPATTAALRGTAAELMVASRHYEGTTLEDYKNLEKAARLIRQELLPLLEPGSELYKQYSEDLNAIKAAQNTLEKTLYEKKLEEERTAAATLPEKTDPLEKIEQHVAFLGEQIAAWDAFSREVPIGMAITHQEALVRGLAAAKREQKSLIFQKLVDQEIQVIRELLDAGSQIRFSTTMTAAKKGEQELAAIPLPELQAVQAKAVELRDAWQAEQTRLGDPEFAKEKIEDYNKALAAIQAMIDLKSGKTNDPVAYHQAKEAEYLAKNVTIADLLEWHTVPGREDIFPPSFDEARIENEEGYGIIAHALSWLRGRIAFWEGLSDQMPDLMAKINPHLAKLKILERVISEIHMRCQIKLAKIKETRILDAPTGLTHDNLGQIYLVARDAAEDLTRFSLTDLENGIVNLTAIIAAWEPVVAEFPANTEISDLLARRKSALENLRQEKESREDKIAETKATVEIETAALYPATDKGATATLISSRMQTRPDQTQDLHLANMEAALVTMQQELAAWKAANEQFPQDHPFATTVEAKKAAVEALAKAIEERKAAIAGARITTQRKQAQSCNTTLHGKIFTHTKQVVRQLEAEPEQIRALVRAWSAADLASVISGYAEGLSFWEASNSAFPHELPFDEEVSQLRTALNLTKKALAQRLHQEALAEADKLYAVTGPDGRIGINSAVAVSVAAAGGPDAVDSLRKETLDQLRITRSIVANELGIWTRALELGRRVLASPADARLLQVMEDIAQSKTRALENLDQAIALKEAIKPAAPTTQTVYHAGGAEGVISFPDRNIHGLTAIGARKANEDAILYFEDGTRKVFVCFDGMGGHAGGEVASRIASEVFAQALAKGKSLVECVALAQAAILKAVEENRAECAARGEPPTLVGMGSTVAAYEVRGNTLIAVNVGDAPIYVLKKNGELQQVSTDDNLAANVYTMDTGRMPTPPMSGTELQEYHESFRNFIRNNVILRALGQTDSTPHVYTCELEEGDTVLGMTDGPRDAMPYNAASKKSGEDALASFVELLDPNDSVVDIAAKIHQATESNMTTTNSHRDNISVFAYRHQMATLSAYERADIAEYAEKQTQGAQRDEIRTILNQGTSAGIGIGELARDHSLESLIAALSAIGQYQAFWQRALEEEPTNKQIEEKLAHRTAAIAKVCAAIELKAASASQPVLAALNEEANKEIRVLIRAYLVYHADPANFSTIGAQYVPYKRGNVVVDPPVASITRDELLAFIKLLVTEADTMEKVVQFCNDAITRTDDYRKTYLEKLATMVTVLSTAAQTPTRPVKELKAVLLGELFGKFAADEVESLAMPKAAGGYRLVATPSDFYAYVELYLRDPITCIRAENERLAQLYASLPKAKKGGWKGLVGGKTTDLTPDAEKIFDKAVRTAMLTRTKIEGALFPNGHKITKAAEITADKYEEVDDNPFLRQHDCAPALMDAQLGTTPEHGEIAGINKGDRNSEGNPSEVFDFVLAAKKEAIVRLASGQLQSSNDKVGLARHIFDQLHIAYSDKQSRKRGQTGQFRTMAFFMVNGGCCRHRSPVLQLAYQEAGIRSTVYMGYAEKSDRFPGMLSGAHEWVMFDPVDSGTMTHLADPNRQYDDSNPKARFIGRVVESTATGWTAADHPELFDGNTHIFDFKSMSDTYRKFTGRVHDHEISYFVAVELFNFIWRPHLSIDQSELQREAKSQA